MALDFPSDVGGGDYRGVISFAVVEEEPVTADDTKSAAGSTPGTQTEPGTQAPKSEGGPCRLYLPRELRFEDVAEYNTQADLGMLGAVAEGAIRGGAGITGFGDAVTKIGNLGASIIEGLKNPATSGPQAKLAATVMAEKFGGEQIGNAAKSVSKVTPNPNTRALFERVPLRSFGFSFVMLPKNQEETDNIKEIINFFRSELYPETIPAGDLSLGYKFPNKFQIDMAYDGQPVATKIKECYLQNFTTVYNSTSMGMHPGGGFFDVAISMQFTEAAALSRADIEDGF